jgi:ribonuclease T2
VQTAVRFAREHNLCISVAGTGHEFLNRHSCEDGVFIRTSLLKDVTWDLTDSKGFGHADGNVKLGAGLVWSEAHKTAADNNRFVASGWAATVGVVGWSLGGGHGPFSPGKGLGVDNILEVDIVLHDGTLVTAN